MTRSPGFEPAHAAGSLAGGHRYLRSGSYAVVVKVTDSRGVSVTQTFTVTVANSAPRITSISPVTGSSYGYGAIVPVSVAFTDAGPADTHTCTIGWGDGTSSTGIISEANGSGTCSAAHPYPVSGNYTITVTLRDAAGALATAATSIKITTKKAASNLRLTAPTVTKTVKRTGFTKNAMAL